MCSTCDFTKYIKEDKEVNGKVVAILKGDTPNLDINCDVNGKNYKIGNFIIYRCPTCGRKLY